jgi:hypothetical protein
VPGCRIGFQQDETVESAEDCYAAFHRLVTQLKIAARLERQVWRHKVEKVERPVALTLAVIRQDAHPIRH